MTDEDRTNEGLDGTIQVKNDTVIVQDPTGGGCYPAISVTDNVEVYIDDIKINGRTEVSSKNKINFVPKEVPPSQEINISIDKGEMQARLTINIIPGKKYIIEDSEPVTEYEASAVRFEELLPERPKKEEILEALKAKGVVFGIDDQAVTESINNRDGTSTVAASGVKPVRGKDAYLVNLYDPRTKGGRDKDDDSLWVDSLDYGTVISVDEGTVVAKKIPPVPGKPGMNVLGEEIPPPETRDIELKAGTGIEISSDGLEAISTTFGRPQVKGTLVSINTVHTVEGDVDIKTGNIYFKGDVLVKGSVTDGMKVIASGNVEVRGFAAHCQIEAGGDILVKRNIVSGKVKAGSSRVNLFPIRDLLLSLDASVDKLKNAVHLLSVNEELKSRPEVKKYGVGVVLKILLDTKFKPVAENYSKLLTAVDSLGDEVELVLNKKSVMDLRDIGSKLVGRGPLSLKSINEIDQMFEKFKRTTSVTLPEIEETLQRKSSITVGYVQHSTMEATGDIVITGRGAYNVKMFSGGNVTIQSKSGFIRGGQVEAQGDVEVHELGSMGGAATSVTVPEGRKIKSAVIHSGVTLKIGAAIKKVQRMGDLSDMD